MDIEQYVNQYVLKNENKIKKICQPLRDAFGIDCFCYGSVENDGNFFDVTDSFEIDDIYFYEQLYLQDPFLVSPHLLRSGHIIYPLSYQTNHINQLLKEKNINQMLCIAEVDEEGFEMYFFARKKKEDIAIFINYLDVFYKFIPYFKKEAKHIIAKKRDKSINIKKVKGEKAFFTVDPTIPLIRKDANMQRLLRCIYPLSRREMQCLELYKRGQTAQSTGALLGISQRTVEYYFDNLKQKLGCQSKTDLLLW